jgi:putative peptidoglycan lipid II flippase
VLLHLRVFYAREQPWIPILVIVVITTVKIAASLAAPHVTDDPELVAGYLGTANGLGFVAGAITGALLLRRTLRPPGGRLIDRSVTHTIMVTVGATLTAAALGYLADRGFGLDALTTRYGGIGSLLRLSIVAVIMMFTTAAVLFAARVPEARSVLALLQRRIRRGDGVARDATVTSDSSTTPVAVPYAEPSDQRSLRLPEAEELQAEVPRGARMKGPAVSDDPSTRDDVPRTPGTMVGTTSPTAGSEPTVTAMPVTRPSAPTGVPLTPGATISGGRYRLLVFHGGPTPLQFWQALDTALDRQVALTFVDPDGTLPDEAVRDILDRTSQLSQIDRSGIARVLDVTGTATGGLVVSEWIRGGSLREVAETSPSPIGGTRAVQSLAGAADVAHQAGATLSIDHPSRIRVSIDGDVTLAFPATLPEATPEDDIRGIGATLYALLVNRWPLPEAGTPSGMTAADTDAVGQPLEPRTVDRSIPFQISAAATRSVQVGGGIRTAPTLLNLLQQATALADRTESLDPVRPVATEVDTVSGIRAAAGSDALARHRRSLMIGLGIAAAVIVVALVVLASVLGRIFGDVGGGIDGDQLGLSPQTSTSSATPEAGATVKPVAVTVFSPAGGADAPSLARLAIDGDTTTMWPTDTYTDNNAFPNFKNGVGLMLQLPSSTKIGSVDVGVTSTGTRIQIRSATSATPASLDDTVALTQPALMKTGQNTIEVNSETSTSYVLVWISTLGTVDGKNRSDITEITVHAAS